MDTSDPNFRGRIWTQTWTRPVSICPKIRAYHHSRIQTSVGLEFGSARFLQAAVERNSVTVVPASNEVADQAFLILCRSVKKATGLSSAAMLELMRDMRRTAPLIERHRRGVRQNLKARLYLRARSSWPQDRSGLAQLGADMPQERSAVRKGISKALQRLSDRLPVIVWVGRHNQGETGLPHKRRWNERPVDRFHFRRDHRHRDSKYWRRRHRICRTFGDPLCEIVRPTRLR